MLGKNHLGIVDFCVVAATLLFSLFIGVFYGFCIKKQTNEELLVGGRKMGALPIAASMLVSYLSAITILGYPAEVYTYGMQVFLMTISGIVTYPLAIYFFVSVLYKLKLTSTYKYLELRFDSILVRWLASITFMLKLLFLSGIVLYAPSIAMETMLGLPTWISIIGIGICGTIYTSIGGIKAVVWTDVFQFVMICVGMTAIVVKGVISSGGIVEAVKTASFGGRLDLFDWSIDPFMRHNTFNILLGSGFSAVCLIGTDQPLVQRYSSLPTYRQAVKSLIWSYVFGMFTVSLVIFTGLVIFSTYSKCDPVKSGQISKTDQIVPFFVINELSFIPGMMGLFVAVVFSAVLSTISSTLNSLAAVTWDDFLSKMPFFKNMSDNAQTITYKIVSIIFGIIIILLAFFAQQFDSIFQAAITVIGTASGILGAVFVMGVFMPCVNKFGAIAGMVAGLVCMGFLSIQAMLLQRTHSFQEKLPLSTEECPSDLKFNATTTTNLLTAADLDWPEKFYTVSYILYPIIGGIITIFAGVFVSIFTEGCQKAPEVNLAYTHPLIHPRDPSKKKKKEEINMAYVEDNVEKPNVPKIYVEQTDM